MSAKIQPRRSVLYMPAANSRALEKATTIPADALIFDLEDAVAPDSKEIARAQAAQAVESGRYGHRELAIRCNGLDTPWGAADLVAAAQANPAAVVIPKVDSVDYLASISDHLDRAGASPELKIWAMIETPAAILDTLTIAGHDRVEALVMGTNDLAKELRATLVPGRGPLISHLAHALLAGRAAGKTVIDGVFNNISDEEGFAAECVQGMEMGFDGKTLIHPKQVEVANQVWAPTEEDITYAQRVIEAFTAAEAEGKGVVTVDGRMIENLHVDNARRTLATAQAIAALD